MNLTPINTNPNLIISNTNPILIITNTNSFSWCISWRLILIIVFSYYLICLHYNKSIWERLRDREHQISSSICFSFPNVILVLGCFLSFLFLFALKNMSPFFLTSFPLINIVSYFLVAKILHMRGWKNPTQIEIELKKPYLSPTRVLNMIAQACPNVELGQETHPSCVPTCL